MPKISHTLSLVAKRKLRIRSKLNGTAVRPRVSIYRSNKHTYLQAINDEAGVTVAAMTDAQVTDKKAKTKIEKAQAAAQNLAAQLDKKGIKAVVLDRGSYRYHGRIRAVADALRTAGVEV